MTAGSTEPEPAGPTELVEPPHANFWQRRSGWARASLVLTTVAVLLTAMMLILVIGMWRNDAVIAADPRTATATVLTVTPLSTGIEFVDSNGVAQRPQAGALYPGGLRVGQQFLVEYAGSDPTLVRVAGRTARNGLIMPALVVAGTWLVAAPALLWLRRVERTLPADLVAALARHAPAGRPAAGPAPDRRGDAGQPGGSV